MSKSEFENFPLTQSKDLHLSSSTIERIFANYLNVKYCCFTNSGRSALYLIYKSLNSNGKEVIVSPLTCSAAILPIIYSGLKPHFMDIDPDTFNINPEEVNEAISQNTVAIQLIHLAGNPCDIEPIKKVTEDNNVMLIEDCAQGMGAEYDGKKVGSYGISCFSFPKFLPALGGMIAGNDQNIISRCRELQYAFPSSPIKGLLSLAYAIKRAKGGPLSDVPIPIIPLFQKLRSVLSKSDSSDNRYDFFKSFLVRPTNLQAFVVYSQFNILSKTLKRLEDNAKLLISNIESIDSVKIQKTTRKSKRVYPRLMMQIKKDCVGVIKELRTSGIGAIHLTVEKGGIYQQRFDKGPLFSCFNSIKNCKNYLEMHDKIVTLPISPNEKERKIEMIAEKLRQAIE